MFFVLIVLKNYFYLINRTCFYCFGEQKLFSEFSNFQVEDKRMG